MNQPMGAPRRVAVTTRTKLVVAGLALAGVLFFVLAWQVAGDDGSDDVSVTRTEGLVAINPVRGSEVLKQEPVRVTLDTGWRLVAMRLYDNPSLAGGTNVTPFVMEFSGLNEWVYTPDEDGPWEEHSADDNCVVIEFEDLTRPGDIRDLDWCFTAS